MGAESEGGRWGFDGLDSLDGDQTIYVNESNSTYKALKDDDDDDEELSRTRLLNNKNLTTTDVMNSIHPKRKIFGEKKSTLTISKIIYFRSPSSFHLTVFQIRKPNECEISVAPPTPWKAVRLSFIHRFLRDYHHKVWLSISSFFPFLNDRQRFLFSTVKKKKTIGKIPFTFPIGRMDALVLRIRKMMHTLNFPGYIYTEREREEHIRQLCVHTIQVSEMNGEGRNAKRLPCTYN